MNSIRWSGGVADLGQQNTAELYFTGLVVCFQHWLTRDSRILVNSILWSGGVADLGQQNTAELYQVVWQCGFQHWLTWDSRILLNSIQWSGGVPFNTGSPGTAEYR